MFKRLKPTKAGLLTKLLVICLLAYATMTVLHVREQISDTEAEAENLNQQIEQQKQTNMELANAIENRDDPSFIKDIAREKLDLIEPGEQVFDIVD